MRRGRWLLPVSTALVGVALALVGNLATNTVQVKAGWVPLVWVATALLVVAAVALQAGSGPEQAGWPATPEAAMRALRETVDVQWRDEAVRILSLANAGPMPVPWNLTSRVEVTERSGQVELAGPVDWSGTADDIAAIVQRLKSLSPGRLVILGGPGAGKTTLAIQLLRRLLATRKKGEPVPVLLSVSGWDPAEHVTFKSWLTAQLQEAYPSLREPAPYHARRLFELGHLLPILDGLDELPAGVRPRVLRLVNDELDENSRLVLTSRTREYASASAAGEMLSRAAVIEAKQLSPEAAADHLAAQLRRSLPHPGWRLLINDLRAGHSAALAEVLANPLGLWLLRTAYDPAGDPSALLDGERFDTPERIRSHLFGRLVPELVRLRRPASGDDADLFRPRHAYEAADVERWLSQLADILRQSPRERKVGRLSTGSRDFAWWSLAARVLPYPLPAPAFLLAAALMGCAWIVLIGHVVFGLGVLDSVVFALGLLLLAREGKYTGYWTDHRPAAAIRKPSRRVGQLPGLFLRALPFGLLTFAVIAIVYAGFELIWSTPAGALRLGVRAGVLAGLVLILAHLCDGLTAWTGVPAGDEPASTPFASWRADRTAQLVRLLVAAALAGVTSVVAIVATSGELWQIALGMVLGLMAGAIYALVSGHHNAWPTYLMATVRLGRRDLMPRRLMPFLEDAHRLGLLRAVGPVYQFRHADFQDYLAARHLPATRSAPAPVVPVPAAHQPPERLAPELLRTFKVPRWLLDVAWSPDGRTIALFRDGSTGLIDLSGRRLRRIRHGLAPLRMLVPSGAVAFSPDGSRFAVTGGTVRLWPLGRLVGHARIFEIGTARELLRLGHPGWIQALAFSPDGTRLATGGDESTVRIWDAATGQQLLVIRQAGEVSSVAFSPDGLRLATGTYIVRDDGTDGATTEVWDVATGEALLRLRIDPVRFHNIESVAFSPDGRLVAAVNGWATTVWDAVTGSQVLTLSSGGNHVEFSPDNVHFVTSGSGPHVDLRRISDGSSLFRITHAAWVTRALFSPDARLLLSVGQDRTAQLWRLWPAGEPTRPLAD